MPGCPHLRAAAASVPRRNAVLLPALLPFLAPGFKGGGGRAGCGRVSDGDFGDWELAVSAEESSD